MKLLDQIKRRRSVRTFTGYDLSDSDLQNLLKITEDADNPYQQQITWKTLDAAQYDLRSPVLSGVHTYLAGKMKRAAHAEEAFGFSFEKIILALDKMGLGTCWIAGTMNRDAFERALDCQSDEVLPCVSPIGYPAKKMSLKEGLMRKGIHADERLPLDQLCFEEQFGSPLSVQKSQTVLDILEVVRWAPSAVNKQPWRIIKAGAYFHFYEQHSRGYVDKNNWDIQKIDIGIALYHFFLAAKEYGINAAFLIQDPGIPVPDDMEYIASYTIS